MMEPSIKLDMKPRILVIYTHPDPAHSVANKALLQASVSLEHVTFRDLYGLYPDFFIDVAAEQALLTQHDIIVFQHPLYMYSCPALLKEWMDRVLCKGFAFGSKTELAGKIWRSVITTGGKKEAFCNKGYNKYPLEEILQPFELTAALCQMQWVEPLVLYWARNVSETALLRHADDYRHWLLQPLG